MRISNTSDLPIAAVRTIVRWVAARLEVSDYVRTVRVTNCKAVLRGRCWARGEVLIRIGPASRFPYPRTAYRQGAPEYGLDDRYECLVAVAAHEFQHARQFRANVKRQSEVDCEWAALRVLSEFREQRDAIMAAIEVTSQTHAARVHAACERQAARTSPETQIAALEARVAAWQTKVKRATTFLKKWERRLRRAKKAANPA